MSLFDREISAAQDRMTLLLQRIFLEQPEKRELVRLIMATVGRGGQGDVGQRIRDEILVIQVSSLLCYRPYIKNVAISLFKALSTT